MTSLIDPTKPEDGIPASKSVLRGNLAAAKDEIEALQDELAAASLPEIKEEIGTAISVDAAYFGLRGMVIIDAANGDPITVTLEEDVEPGKSVHVVQRGAGVVTVEAGAGASLTVPAGSSAITAVQFGSLVAVKMLAGEWLVIDRGETA